MRDEELAAAGVFPVERHADGAAQVRTLVDLVANREAGAAFAVAAWIAALDHEVGHDAMEGEAVEESAPGERDEVVNRERRVSDREIDVNPAASRLDRCARGVLRHDDLRPLRIV